MKYQELIIKFWEIAEKHHFSANTSYLYLYLLEMWRRNDYGDFEISDNEISKSIKQDRKTIKKVKQTLRDTGLISYQQKNGLPSFYKIITDYSINREAKKTTIIAEKRKEEVIIPIIPTEIPTKNEKTTTSTQKVKENNTPIYPTFEEFITYAKTLELYNDNLYNIIKNKYENWQANNWVNGYGIPINNWKTTLKNSLPYIHQQKQNLFPSIKRPKATYNE